MPIAQYFDPYHQEPDATAPVVESSATKLGTPTLSLEADGQTAINATIGSVNNAGGYILQLATNSGYTAGLQSFFTTSLTKAITGLTVNTLYYGRVQAIGSGFINSDFATDTETTEGLPNVAPTVDAGNAASVNLPTQTMALNGTASDSDGSIAGVLWTIVGTPPSGVTISNATTLNATLNNPNEIAGAITAKLTATGNLGLTGEDTVVKTFVYVNPSVSAGADVNITLPTNSGTLTATPTQGSYPIVSTVWAKVSGAGTVNSDGTYSGLTQGTTVARVTVTDSKGITAQDDVNIIVAAAPAHIEWGYFSSDPSGTLASLTFQFNTDITAGATSYELDFSSAVFAGDKYLVIKEPSSEPAKTAWFNTALNSEPAGSIPGFVYSTTIIGDFRYYYTNDVASIDGSTSEVTYSVS